MNKDTMKKASNGKDVYYPETINLDGIDYLVYNNRLDNARTKFFTWTKNVIFSEREEIETYLQ